MRSKLLNSKCSIIFWSTVVLSGCAVPHNDVMVFGTETKLALDVSAQPQNASVPEFTLGYKRKEFVWMPLFVNGVDSRLRNHIQGNTLVADDSTEVTTPSGSNKITIAPGQPAFLPAGTIAKFDDKTEVIFTKGTLVSLSEGEDLTIKPSSSQKLRAGSIIGIATGSKLDGIDIESAKYLSKEMVDNGMSHDTYSVLATFGSDVKLAKDGETGVGIAQYFATGLAARNLTSKGDSGLVSLQGATANQVQELKNEKAELQKKNEDLLVQNIGLERSRVIQAAAKQRVTNDHARVQLIVANVTDAAGKLDKDKLRRIVDSTKIPNALKKRIKGYSDLDKLEGGLRTRDNSAIKPIFDEIYTES